MYGFEFAFRQGFPLGKRFVGTAGTDVVQIEELVFLFRVLQRAALAVITLRQRQESTDLFTNSCPLLPRRLRLRFRGLGRSRFGRLLAFPLRG